jgi:GNAT superfamily N-acetyltransferase
MRKVLEMTRTLNERPKATAVDSVRLRTFDKADDATAWLELRQRAFARESLAVRAWSAAEFQTEFLGKPWWNPATMWFAESDRIIGSVTLARRESSTSSKPVVHWLMVDPRWRRHGIARLLLTALETAVWDAGQRQIWLETHSAWTKAEQFYRAMGYRETTTS